MKIGFIDISKDLLEEEPKFFEKYLPDVKIVDSHTLFTEMAGSGVIRYKCEHEEFEDINVGDTIPEYAATFDRDADGVVTRRPFHRAEYPCDYCGNPVEYPLPIHPNCAKVWLMGYESAREYYNKESK